MPQNKCGEKKGLKFEVNVGKKECIYDGYLEVSPNNFDYIDEDCKSCTFYQVCGLLHCAFGHKTINEVAQRPEKSCKLEGE